jgi:hypothetical protein
MKFLASFILSVFIVAYAFLVNLLLNSLPVVLSPVITILALALAIYLFTTVANK